DPRTVLLEPMEATADVSALRDLAGVREIEQDGSIWKLALTQASDPAEVIRGVVAAVPPARVELHRPSLEDVFVQIVTASAAAGGRGAAQVRASVSEPAPAAQGAQG
ncbi:MAG: DUF4162 domain-containing protein, partial [Acidobacteriota bacterium]